MLIDIHTHTTRANGVTRANGSRYPTPEELVEMMDVRGIDRAVILCAVSPECRYCFVPPEQVLEMTAEHPDRFIPFTCLDPRMLGNGPESDFSDLLTHYVEAGCRGIGEYTPNIPFDDPMNMNLFAQVQETGLPITFHIAPQVGACYGVFDEVGLPRLEKVLKAFPKLTFLGHSQPFWAEISADVNDDNRRGYPEGKVTPGRVVELMREYPNLHGDLSAGSGHNAISRDREFGYAFLEEFQDRLYFGTDLANVPQQTPAVEYFRTLKDENLIDPEAWEKITWRNAARLLNLNLVD